MSEMDRARLASLIERIVPYRDGLHRLIGPIGPLELAALKALIGDHSESSTGNGAAPVPPVILDLGLLLQDPISRGLMCIDFGTAASKIAFDPGNGMFVPLAIGRRAEEPDNFWVLSTIAIDAAGQMLFGSRAELAAQKGAAVVRSFKSRLWGAPDLLDERALQHAGVSFSYRDCIQIYLAFLSRLGGLEAEENLGDRHSPRRYAMPYAYDEGRREVREVLGTLLSRAVVLADTFEDELIGGLDVGRARSALDAASTLECPPWILAPPKCVGEPVAAGSFAMEAETGSLTVYMIIDIGAGTTDFCILCIKKRADDEIEPFQIKDGARSIEVAGDAVDRALVDFIVREQAGEQGRSAIERQIRALKERLFQTGVCDLTLPGQLLVSVELDDFLRTPEWQGIVTTLRQAQASVFDMADLAYVQRFGTGPIRVVLTGGGSALPLHDALSEGRSAGTVEVALTPAHALPEGLRDRFAQIEPLLPRLAVALGGSREVLPADQDRTSAKASKEITPPRAWKALDKTAVGLGWDDGADVHKAP